MERQQEISDSNLDSGRVSVPLSSFMLEMLVPAKLVYSYCRVVMDSKAEMFN